MVWPTGVGGESLVNFGQWLVGAHRCWGRHTHLFVKVLTAACISSLGSLLLSPYLVSGSAQRTRGQGEEVPVFLGWKKHFASLA